MSPKTIHVGLVGAGGISHLHLPSLLRLGAEVLVHSEEGAAELTREYGGTAVGSLDELLDRVDLVDVVTPTHTHAGIALAALAAGKDVICEKPFARTDSDAAAMVAAARAAGRQLYPAHVVRYFPEYVQLKQAVDSGALGDIAVSRFVRGGSTPTRPWFTDLSLSGGVVMDQMIHDLDQARWIAGEVVQVSAVATAEDAEVRAAHVLLTHASGAISQVSGLWGPPSQPFGTEFSVTGTAGSLSHNSFSETSYLLRSARPAATDGFLPPIDPQESPYLAELRELVRAVQGGPEPRVTAADGLMAVRLANAALTSIRTGQPVTFAEEGV